MTLADYITDNYDTIERMAKIVLGKKHQEGISLYYLHLHTNGVFPDDIQKHCYWYFKNIDRPYGELNYYNNFKKDILIDNDIYYSKEQQDNYEDILDMKIDLQDDKLMDFFLNNPYTEKWLKIYSVIYENKIKLDFFERIMYDYVFLKGYTRREIQEITGNSKAWVFKFRKGVIEKIKKAVEELDK